jgi:hypothetical protein
MAFCGNCGTELKEGQAFCPNCGAPTGLAPAQTFQNAAGNNPPQPDTFDDLKEKAGDVFGRIDTGFGNAADKVNDFVNNQIVSLPNEAVDPDDGNVTWMNVIAFLLPIVGLIIYFVNRARKPVMSKNVLKWTLIGIVAGLVLRILGFV